MNLRKLLPALILVAAAAAPSRAFNPYDTFKAQAGAAASSSLEGFAKDLGGLLGANDFHSARLPSLTGFDVGASAVVQLHPDKDDGILKLGNIDKFGLPLVRVEAGLPMGFSVFLRGIPLQGAKLIGGGARYQIYKSGLLLAIPDISATLAYDKLTHDAFNIGHIGASVQASFNLPVIHPFIGVGVDSTKLTAKDPTVVGVLNGAGTGTEFTGKGTRVSVGASLTLIPFTYVFGAYNLMHGQSAGQLGLGIKFGGIL